MNHSKTKCRLFALLLTGVLLLCSCGSIMETLPPETVSTPLSSEPLSSPGTQSTEPDFRNSATRLSIRNGKLQIDRRSRESRTPMGEGNWTLFLYLCGTDLETDGGAASNDLREIIGSQFNEKVRIVIQTGGTRQWQSPVESDKLCRFINVDGDLELVETLPQANMGEEETLCDFLTWGVRNYPAEKMGVILWNHGGGSISGVCFDQLHENDSLSLREIDRALNKVYDSMSDQFEFIGCDSCLMSTFETANILAPHARYMYCSPELEPGSGWDYTALLDYLAEHPEADGKELGEVQCESFYQHCLEIGSAYAATFAVLDLSKLDALIKSFDATAKELYESKKLPELAKEALQIDNYGGNNRTEGYTNMVDLKALLEAAKKHAASAADAIAALEAAVIYSVSGEQHQGFGGLSVYYPLSVSGSYELETFGEVCPAPYYLGLVDAIAAGTSGKDPQEHDNSQFVRDTEDLWQSSFSFDPQIGSNQSDFTDAEESSSLEIEAVYLDENGTYTVKLKDFDSFALASCSVYLISEDGSRLYLGEDDEVSVDYETGLLTDNFVGSWLSMDGILLPIELVSVNGILDVYTCHILLNGEETNLRVEYDWIEEEWKVLGTWSGIDTQTGMAARETVALKDSDVITPLYARYEEESLSYVEGESYTVQGKIPLYHDALPAADYSYSMVLYDIYGNCFYTEHTVFTVAEDGTLYFYPVEG